MPLQGPPALPFGYGYRGSRYYGGGLGILGTILVVILLLWLLGALR
jgi:hypothetical protein